MCVFQLLINAEELRFTDLYFSYVVNNSTVIQRYDKSGILLRKIDIVFQHIGSLPQASPNEHDLSPSAGIFAICMIKNFYLVPDIKIRHLITHSIFYTVLPLTYLIFRIFAFRSW